MSALYCSSKKILWRFAKILWEVLFLITQNVNIE